MSKNISFEMRVGNFNRQWNEDINDFSDEKGNYYPEPKTDNKAISQAKAIISFFNRTLRPGERSRELVSVTRKEIIYKSLKTK